jgi:hypothetical protein
LACFGIFAREFGVAGKHNESGGGGNYTSGGVGMESERVETDRIK